MTNLSQPSLLAACLLVALASSSLAADLPRLMPPDPGRWSVAVRTAGQPAHQDGEPIRPGTEYDPVAMKFSRAGGLTHIQVEFRNGERREYWKMNQYTLTKASNQKVIVLRDDPLAPTFPYASTGFYGMENLRPEHLVGEVQYDGATAVQYSGVLRNDTVEPPAPDDQSEAAVVASSDASTYDAWFDAETGLLRAYREGPVTFSYSFDAAPPSTLALPEDFRAGWERYQKNLMRMRMR